MPRAQSGMDASQVATDPVRVIPQPAIALWAVLFVAALAATGVYDERISQRLADPQSSWAQFFEHYGEIPGYLTSAVGAAIVLATNNRRAPSGEYDRRTLAAARERGRGPAGRRRASVLSREGLLQAG